MKKKIVELENLNKVERRRFLKAMAMFLSTPAFSPLLSRIIGEQIGGEAFAQSLTTPKYFIEISLRDQWNFQHIFLNRSLVSNLRNIPINNRFFGEGGDEGFKFGDSGLAFYHGQNSLRDAGRGFYLTPVSGELAPHLENIAVIDTCEPTGGGPVHGHESSNPIRIPDRKHGDARHGKALWRNDINAPTNGSVYSYGNVPTLDCLHNSVQKQANPNLRNGVVIKGGSRNFMHSVYHFEGNLANGKMSPYHNASTLLGAFPRVVNDQNFLASNKQASVLSQVLKRLDARYLAKMKAKQEIVASQNGTVDEIVNRLYSSEGRQEFDISMSAADRSFWSSGVPDQNAHRSDRGVKFNLWEQAAYAFNLIKTDQVRSVALEFDLIDLHESFKREHLDIMAKQVVLPLSRLIQKLKEAQIFDQTVIYINSADGSRHPRAFSYADGGSYYGKNVAMIAGGKINGGVYGDTSYSGGRYYFHSPDLNTGARGSGYYPNRQNYNNFVKGSHIWKTVGTALGIPSSTLNAYSGISSAKVLNFMLKS